MKKKTKQTKTHQPTKNFNQISPPKTPFDFADRSTLPLFFYLVHLLFSYFFFLLSCMGFYAKKYVKEKEKSNQPQHTSHHRTCPPTPFSTFFNQLFSSHFFLVLLRCVQFCVPYTFPSTTLALSLIVSPLFFVVRFRYARRLSALRHGNQFFSASFV